MDGDLERASDREENIRTSLEGYKFDSELAAVVGTQMACLEGCQFSIRVSNAILRKEKFVRVAILKVRRAAVNGTIWGCDAFTEVPNSPLRVVSKENPNSPGKLAEAPSGTTAEPTNIVLKEAPDVVINVRAASPAGINKSASNDFEETPAEKKHKTASDSSYAQAFAAIEE